MAAASPVTRSAPTPNANAPALMKSAAVVRFTPPVARSSMCGREALMDLR
jgi:hypothetical protein